MLFLKKKKKKKSEFKFKDSLRQDLKRKKGYKMFNIRENVNASEYPAALLETHFSVAEVYLCLLLSFSGNLASLFLDLGVIILT